MSRARILVDHASKPECRQTFEAKIETGTLADIELVLFESPMNVIRSAQHAARANDSDLFLCRQIWAFSRSNRKLVRFY